jgi:hypothetical protein
VGKSLILFGFTRETLHCLKKSLSLRVHEIAGTNGRKDAQRSPGGALRCNCRAAYLLSPRRSMVIGRLAKHHCLGTINCHLVEVDRDFPPP